MHSLNVRRIEAYDHQKAVGPTFAHGRIYSYVLVLKFRVLGLGTLLWINIALHLHFF